MRHQSFRYYLCSQAIGWGAIIKDLTDTLDHIRSLIDQDPENARREITTFSRLLRSGHLKS